MPRRKGTPRTFNSRPLRPGEAPDARAYKPSRLGMSACDSRHCTTATNRRGGPRKAQERPSPPSPLPLPRGGAQARQRPSTPQQKTGTLMLFPALDCRKHLASAVRLVTIDTRRRAVRFLPSVDGCAGRADGAFPHGWRLRDVQPPKLDPASAVDLAVHRIGWNSASSPFLSTGCSKPANRKSPRHETPQHEPPDSGAARVSKLCSENSRSVQTMVSLSIRRSASCATHLSVIKRVFIVC